MSPLARTPEIIMAAPKRRMPRSKNKARSRTNKTARLKAKLKAKEKRRQKRLGNG